jgi:transposase
MEHPVVGIDIGKSKFHVCLLLSDNKSRAKVFANSAEGHLQLLEWLQQFQISCVHACLEATGNYGVGLAKQLVQAGHLVSIVNPSRIQGFAQSEMSRTKTDKVDAAVIARFCAALRPTPWQPLPEEVEQLQAMVRRLEALGRMLQQEKNRLEVVTTEPVKASMESLIEHLQEDIANLRQLIREHFDQHAHLRSKRNLLVSIPGIGEQTAAVILAEIGDIESFKSAKQLAAYGGLTPRERTSGTSVRGKPRLSRVGNRRLRKALYMPAVCASIFNPLLNQMRERLLSRGKCKMAVLGAVMRKLLHLAYGVLKSGIPFDAQYKRTTAPT